MGVVVLITKMIVMLVLLNLLLTIVVYKSKINVCSVKMDITFLMANVVLMDLMKVAVVVLLQVSLQIV